MSFAFLLCCGPSGVSGHAEDKSAEPVHVPVLLAEVLQYLAPEPGQIIVDCTLGGGGHAAAILSCLGPSGVLIGLDQDPAMLERAGKKLGKDNVRLVHANFARLRDVLDRLGVDRVDGILADLGVSSDQLASADRGFSFRLRGPLDMRLDPTAPGPTAADIVNRSPERELVRILNEYGEERFARRIARAIVDARRREPIRTTEQLAAIVRAAVPPRYERGRIDPATRTFQALRIAVNRELDALRSFLEQLPRCLRVGGRAVVISFHSLEDRLVKQAFANHQLWDRLTKKPVRPSAEEVAVNPRARSARLRAARLRKSLNGCGVNSR